MKKVWIIILIVCVIAGILFFVKNREQIPDNNAKDIICIDENKEKYLLSSLVKDKKSVLIYRYSDVSCNTCVEVELKHLHSIFKDRDDAIILCSYHIERDYYVFKRLNQIKLRTCKIDHDAFDLDKMGRNSNAYYFVLHSNMNITDVFVPDKMFPDASTNYLLNILNKLNNQ